jgi:hypothetical protein
MNRQMSVKWRSSMINKTKTAVALALLVASTSAALAHVRHAPRHGHRIDAGAPVSSNAPARMIEVRPGLWVGSYQCITDLERGGRDCSSGI